MLLLELTRTLLVSEMTHVVLLLVEAVGVIVAPAERVAAVARSDCVH